MDVNRMMEVIRQKHGTRLDQDDSVFLLGTIAEEVQREAMEEMRSMLAKAVDDIATTVMMAENSARTKGRELATEAVKFGADKIRVAGVDAANAVASKLDVAVNKIETAANMAIRAAWIGISGAVATIAAVILLVVLIFR
jgi:hypothetical protein